MDLKAIPLEKEYESAALDFIREQCTDHPELARSELHAWQRAHRFIVIHEGKIVGYTGQIPQEFHTRDGRVHHLGFGITVQPDMLHGDEIRKASGRALLNIVENNPPWRYAGVGMIPTIVPVYERRGHEVHRDDTRMYARLFKPERVLDYFASKATWQHMRRNKILSIPIRLGNFFFGMTGIDHGLQRITSFDPAWDPIWRRLLSEQYELYGKRDADYLNYKLNQPDREYFAFLHRDPVSTEIDGYVVFRHASHPKGVLNLLKVCDLVGTRIAKHRLLEHVCTHYRPGWHDSMVAMASREDEDIYKAVGVWVSRPYMVMLPKGISEKIHVTMFDSDLDNLW